MTGPARLRVSARFLLRSLDLRGSHFLLALLSVAVGVSIAATAFDLRADLERKMSRQLRAYGPNLLISPRDATSGPAQGSPGLDEAAVRARLSGAEATVIPVPLLYATGRTHEGGVTVAGVDLEAARSVFSTWSVDGGWPEPDAGAAVEIPALVGSNVAALLVRRPGQRMTVDLAGGQRLDLTVAGIVRSGEAEDDQVFVPLRALQEATRRPGAVSLVAVRVEGGRDEVENFAGRLEATGAAFDVRVVREVARAEGRLLDRLDLMMRLLGSVILAISALCVMTTLVTVVVQRRSEIALMRSLGAKDGEIVLMLLGEATLLGLAGGLLGFGLGVLNARLLGHGLFGAAIAARPEVLPLVLALAVGICWLGVVVPLRRALSIRPADALRGE